MVSFNFSFDPNVSSEQRSVFEAAGLLWSQFLEDDMSVNLHVKVDDDMPSNILGGAVPGLFADQTYDTIQSALIDDATSGIDTTTDEEIVSSKRAGFVVWRQKQIVWSPNRRR